MKMEKKLIIVTLILLSLFMISTVSAATDNLDDVVKSDATHKETIKHTDTTTTDTSSEKIVEKTNTNTINEKKSINNDKKEEKEEDEVNKLSTTTNNDLLKEGTDNRTFTTLNKNNDKDTLKETQPINNWNDLKKAINNGTEDIKLTNNITTNGESIKINGKVRINGDGHTIDAEKTGTQGIFSLGDGASLILENLKIINGQKISSGGAISTGYNCNLTVTNCTFNQNTANDDGGAIYTGDNCKLTVTNCTFNQNTANDDGGAIRTGYNCNLTVTNCTFNQNTATDYGGAISTDSNCDVNVDNALFCNNNAQSGDGIKCSDGGTHIIKNSAFINDGYNGISDEGKIESINDDGTSFRVLNAWVNYGNPYVILTKDYTYNSTTDNENYKNGIKITRDVTINGNGHTISGNQEARIFTITNQAKVTITNTTLTQGQGQTETINGGEYNVGGAIYTNNATITLINTTFNQNTATWYGGAISAYAGATVNINNATFKQNTATLFSGGAIFAYDGAININNTQFNQNAATGIGGDGGAISAQNGATVNINNTQFTNNRATCYGGAIDALSATVNITNATFKQNTATQYSGGAIYATTSATVNINNTTFNQNTATGTYGNGGAIDATTSATVNINNTTFNQNNATNWGGAIHALNGATVNINNTQFNQNTATGTYSGGGAISAGYNSKVGVFSSLFVDNTATAEGCAIYGDRFNNLTVNHNIFLNTGTSVIYLNNDTVHGYAFVYNLDCNWFGNNATTYSAKPLVTVNNKGVGEELSDWLFLTTSNPDPVGILSTSDITFKLSLYNSTSTNVSEYDNKQLYPVNLTLEYRNGTGDSSVLLGDNVTFTPTKLGTGSVTASISTVRQSIGLTIGKEIYYTQITNLQFDHLFEGKPVTVNGTLKYNDTNVLANQKIIVTISNGTYTISQDGYTDSTGKFSITLTPLINGDVNITAIYNGNDSDAQITYNATNTTTITKIAKITYNITFDKVQTSYDYNTTVTITGTITSNYHILDVSNVNITLNNGDKKLVDLNNTGRFTYTFTGNIGGINNITVTCKDDTNTTQVRIKYPTTFTITVSNSTTDEPIHILVEEDNGFSGDVDLVMDNEKIGTVTLIKGSGENNTIVIAKSGTHTITITYLGNETYNATTTTSNKFLILNKTSFAYLQQQIQNATSDKVNNLTLTHDYIYDENTDNDLKDGIIINKTVIIQGNGHSISGNNTATIFHVTENGNLILENIQLTNANGYEGGAIYANNANITLINSTLQNNTATYDGGAIYANNANVTIINSTLQNNTATYDGGAIYTGASNLTINNTILSNNTVGENGGAIYANSDLTVQNSLFKDNNAATGSGLYIDNAVFTNKNNTFINNNIDGDNYKIRPIDPQIKIENINDTVEGNPITIKIIADNEFNNDLILNVNGNNYTVKMINGKGQTTVSNLKPGTYTAIIQFDGNDDYTNTTATSNTFKVNTKPVPPTPTPSPEPTINPTKTVYEVKMYLTLKKVKKISKKTKKLYLKVIVKRNGKKLLTKKITIKVKRNKVKAKKTNKNKAKSKKLSKVQGFKFTVKINNKTYTKKTNKKGKITYTINNLYNKGTYKAKISYKSKYYKKNGKNIKFKVKA